MALQSAGSPALGIAESTQCSPTNSKPRAQSSKQAKEGGKQGAKFQRSKQATNKQACDRAIDRSRFLAYCYNMALRLAFLACLREGSAGARTRRGHRRPLTE